MKKLKKGSLAFYVGQDIWIENPKYIWGWDFFGNNLLVINTIEEISIWKRFWTKIFFGSKWERIK